MSTRRPTRKDIERVARNLAEVKPFTVAELSTKARVSYARAWSVVADLRRTGEVQVVATEHQRPGRPRLVLGKVPTMVISCLEAWRRLGGGLFVQLGEPSRVDVLASMPTTRPREWAWMVRYVQEDFEDKRDSYSLALDPAGNPLLLIGVGCSRQK